MRTKIVLVAILALAVGGMAMNMSGLASIYGTQNPASGLNSPSELEDGSGKYRVGGDGVSGSASSSGDGDIVGLIINGAGKMAGILAIPGMLSTELTTLGLPWWAAYPLGLAANLLVYIGLVQFTLGRVYR